MSEQCTDISQNITKLNNFCSDNIGFTTEIDGRENKEDFLKFSFDHMYACNSDNSDVNSDRQAGDSEVKRLRDLLILHLDLIQQQSDEIVNKDKYISELRLENDTLKQRLERIEGRVKNNSPSTNLQTSPYSNDMTHDTGFCTDNEDSKDNLKVMGLCQEDSSYTITNSENQCINNVYNSENIYSKNLKQNIETVNAGIKIKEEFIPIPNKDNDYQNIYSDSNNLNPEIEMPENNVNSNNKGAKLFALRPSNRRKRLCSNSSQLSVTSVSDEKKKIGRHRKKKLKNHLKSSPIVSCESPYVTQAGEVFIDDSEEIHVHRTRNLEVPRWRVKVYTSCYTMEGTENLDDEVYNKRHLRLETDERRRKRWDVQRIREQRHIEKLKLRHERANSAKNDEQNDTLQSFWPSLEDLKYIEVTDDLPVSAFGCPIPKLAPTEFKLPWLNGIVPQKKARIKKSTVRRERNSRNSV